MSLYNWRHLETKLFCCAKSWVCKLTNCSLKFWDDLSYEYQHWVHYTCTKKTNCSQYEETCLLLFYSTLGPKQYYNIHRTGLLKTGAQLEKSFIHFIQINFTSEKVRSKPHLSTQWARVQVATYTQKMFNKIGSRYGWGKFESCLSNYGQNELQVFFNPCLQPLKVFPEKKNSQHFAIPPKVSPWNDIWRTSTKISPPDIIFGKGTDESITKCCLFSQVTESHLI